VTFLSCADNQRADRAHHSAKFTDAPLAEGKFETYLHERQKAARRKAFAPPVAND
jgi:hypothetical protein